MALVNPFLPTASRRLACSPIGSAAVVIAAAAADQLRVVGAMQPLNLGTGSAPPDWITLIPAGTFATNDGRGPFHNATPDQVVAATLAHLGNREAPADYDHLSEYVETTGQPAIAAGWIKEWRVQDGAIQARVDWTAAAAEKIGAREYRYVSPVFTTDKQNNVAFVHGFALVNRPALDLPAIAAAHTPHKERQLDSKLLAQALGLPETATDAELLASVATIRQVNGAVITASGLAAGAAADAIVVALREKPDGAKWIAASEYTRVNTELGTAQARVKELEKKVNGDEVETVIAAALKEGKLVPGQAEYWRQTCATAGSAEPLTGFLKTAVVVVKPGEQTHASKTPGTGPTLEEGTVITAAMLTPQEKFHCAQQGLSEAGYAASITKLGYRPLAA